MPLVRDEAAASEQQGHLTARLTEALRETGVFRMWVPRSVGGLEVDLITGLRVYELLGRGDGATAWTVMLGSGAGRFAGFFDHEAAREIFQPADAFVAGSGAPSGTARRVEGGYVVDGRWKYASGAHLATWFTANCVVVGADGEPADPDGPPLIRAVAVPAADVRIHRTWSVTGMRGTGSEDFEVAGQFVPERHSFSAVSENPREPGPLYRLPFASVAELSFGTVAAGIGRGALDHFAALARHKKPTGSEHLLREDADAAARYGRAEAAVRAAFGYLLHSAGQLWNAVESGERASAALQIDARLAAVDATSRCAREVNRLQKRTGMSALYADSPFGRAWRDINTATQNMSVSFDRYADAGRSLLEGE